MTDRAYQNFGACGKWLNLALFSIFVLNLSIAQNQQIADSLESVYLKGVDEEWELELLDDLVYNQSDSDKKLIYCQRLIDLATERDSTQYLYSGYLEMGNASFQKGEMIAAHP